MHCGENGVKKEVCVKLKSVQRNLETDEKINISFAVCGTLDESDGHLRLTFDEPKENDLTRCRTVVIFSDPVKMKKNGQSRVEFAFTASPTVCEYKTPLGTFELEIRDAEVKNGVTPDGGTFTADYVSEISGLDPQRIKLRIDVTEKEGLA